MLAARRLALVLVLAFAAPSAALAQQKLKFAHVYETSEPYHSAALWAAGEIAKRTANRYTVDVFPASSLGNETQINQSLTLATVDMIYTGQLFAGRSHGPFPSEGRLSCSATSTTGGNTPSRLSSVRSPRATRRPRAATRSWRSPTTATARPPPTRR